VVSEDVSFAEIIAKPSVRFIAKAAKAPEIPVDSVASISGHPIRRWLYRNIVSYFMLGTMKLSLAFGLRSNETG